MANSMSPSASARSLLCFFCALAILAVGGFCREASAQSLDARPVARLISAGPVYPRAARIVSASASVEPAAAAAPALEDANSFERRAFEETNRQRMSNGLPALTWDGSLCRIARSHSENMARQGFFSHVTPDGQRLRDRARSFGIEHFSVLGENIAYNQGYQDPGGFAVERWMASADHRANILSPEFHSMAIGTFVAADGAVYLTQVFITR